MALVSLSRCVLQCNFSSWRYLQMPYIFWTDWPGENVSNDNPSLSHDTHVHNSMTLDQYYHLSIGDTEDRGRDQVLWRFIKLVHHQSQLNPIQSKRSSKFSLWVNCGFGFSMTVRMTFASFNMSTYSTNGSLSIETIITSTMREPGKIDKPFFKRFLLLFKGKTRTLHYLLLNTW